jgi:competence protein ComEC
MNWHSIPLLRMLIPLLLGLAIDIARIPYSVLLLLYVSLLIVARFSLLHSFRFRWLFGFLLSVFLFFVAAQLQEQQSLLKRDCFFTNHLLPDSRLRVLLVEEPKQSVKSQRLLVEVLQLDTVSTCGRLLLYAAKEEEFFLGDELLVQLIAKEIPAPRASGDFDFKAYMSKREVFHHAYLSEGSWRKIGEKESLSRIALKWRAQLAQLLSENGLKGREYAAALALLLGEKQYLDQADRQLFSAAGVVHVLAVSGLHVGIIYLMLQSLLRMLSIARFKGLTSVISLTVLWSYALLTALSPSVLRATTMFSFIIVGQYLKREGTFFNTLSASAIVLLLIDPQLIHEVSFQLSYLAVAGIVYLYPRLYPLFRFKKVLLDKAWSLMLVSLSAQLATFPLSVYYFQQFPVYFLLANLLVLPLVSVVIPLGFAYLLLSWSAFLSEAIMTILQYVLSLLWKSVRFVEGLPFAVCKDIELHSYEVLLLYAFIFICLRSKTIGQLLRDGLFLFSVYLLLEICL